MSRVLTGAALAVNAQREPQPRREPGAKQVYRWPWWAVPTCGEKSRKVASRATGDSADAPERCGTAGCVEDERARLSKALVRWSYLKATPGFYTFMGTLTSKERITSAEGIEDFRALLKGLFLSAVRAGFWAGGTAVLEVVEKPGEQSEVDCPFRTLPPEEYTTGRQWSAECAFGTCALCGGSGKLAAGHVHAHVLILARPFWFYSGTPETAMDEAIRTGNGKLYAAAELAAREGFALAPGGVGAADWVQAHGLGQQCDFQIARAGAQGYLSKVTKAYLGKISKQHDARRAALYSAAYLRGQGAIGRVVWSWGLLHGLGVNQRRPGLVDCGESDETGDREAVSALAQVNDALGVPLLAVHEQGGAEGCDQHPECHGARVAKRAGLLPPQGEGGLLLPPLKVKTPATAGGVKGAGAEVEGDQRSGALNFSGPLDADQGSGSPPDTARGALFEAAVSSCRSNRAGSAVTTVQPGCCQGAKRDGLDSSKGRNFDTAQRCEGVPGVAGGRHAPPPGETAKPASAPSAQREQGPTPAASAGGAASAGALDAPAATWGALLRGAPSVWWGEAWSQTNAHGWTVYGVGGRVVDLLGPAADDQEHSAAARTSVHEAARRVAKVARRCWLEPPPASSGKWEHEEQVTERMRTWLARWARVHELEAIADTLHKLDLHDVLVRAPKKGAHRSDVDLWAGKFAVAMCNRAQPVVT